jgi:bifunctional non-homologous end joining protein LigD
MSLRAYRAKRDFSKTAEPKGAPRPRRAGGHAYLIQKHAARRLHYDLRLQIGDTLKSWAVTKGPSLKPGDRRLAVHVEDHPLEYGSFEGTIPQGEYGGGTVLLWDRGEWEPVGDPEKGYREGKLKFTLHGEKLHGGWMLIRLKPRSPRDRDNWLLIKERDAAARDGADILAEQPNSVATGRSVDQIAKADGPVWRSNRSGTGAATPAPTRPMPTKPAARKPKPAQVALPGAKRRAMPDFIEPELATRVNKVPSGADWLHEIKFDGYRVIGRIDGRRIQVLTRKGLDWTDKVPALQEALKALPVKQAMVDGEIVVIGPDGISDFAALQSAFSERASERMSYFLFDLMYLDGWDLTGVELEPRKQRLAQLTAELPESAPIKYSDHMTADGPNFFRQSCRFGLEGIVSKRRDSLYRSGRGKDWLKNKCVEREEFVIGGYTKPTHPGPGIGALLVGYYDDKDRLIYAGKVGPGFSQEESQRLRRQLDKLARDTTPFHDLPRSRDKIVHVEPKLVAEIEFTGWTEEGMLRHPSFKGIRKDKDPREVTRADQDPPARAPASATRGRRAVAADAEAIVAGVRISHPGRVLHVGQGLTKLGLAEYYAEVAPWMLPELTNRPLSLLRCPGDHKQGCFFQKHIKAGMSKALRQIPVKEKSGVATYVGIDSLEGLIGLVQFGVIEFHPWGSRADDLDRPDRMIFDLDPDPVLEWAAVTQAATELRDRLSALKLRSFLKTTGGKGLHVVVPLTPAAGWAEVKEFARGVATAMVEDAPDRFVATMTKAKRTGKIFIDFFRNDRGATAIAAYSTRARPGAPIATPLHWDELDAGVRSDHFTVSNIFRRLKALERDPWADIGKVRQTLPGRPAKRAAAAAARSIKRRSRAS